MFGQSTAHFGRGQYIGIMIAQVAGQFFKGSQVLGIVLLTSCVLSPKPQEVQVWEGRTYILFQKQEYRLIATVNQATHDLKGTLENKTSGDRFNAAGTFLPLEDSAELTAEITAQSGVKLKASILGFGIEDLALKANALLSGRVYKDIFKGSLRVNGVTYPLTMKRIK